MALRCLTYCQRLNLVQAGKLLSTTATSQSEKTSLQKTASQNMWDESSSKNKKLLGKDGIALARTTLQETDLETEQKTYIIPPVVPPWADGPRTAFQLFHSEQNWAIKWFSVVNYVKFTPYGIKWVWDEYWWQKLLDSQMYLPERAKMLGSDLAAAHFVAFRGGKVKFQGQDEWHVMEKNSDELPTLPRFYDPNWKTEALDCAGMKLVYEGLPNMKSLDNLKWLSLDGCPYVDDWFLDRIAGEFSHSLEYLSIKDCKDVSERGISSLAKIKNLKTLVLGGQYPKSVHLELVCLMLEEALPKLTIRGIIYCNEGVLEETVKRNLLVEEKRKLQETEEESDNEIMQKRSSQS